MVGQIYIYGENGKRFIVKHIFVGGITDSFELLKNDGYTYEEIAKILNDDWFGEENKLDYEVKERNGKTIIRIVEDLF